MEITYNEVPSEVGVYPKVEVIGLNIVVRQYKGRMGKLEFELKDDEQFTAETRDVDTEFLGYIVQDKEGDIFLLVDEVSVEDPPFDFEEAGFTSLQFIFGFFMPADSNVFTKGRIKKNKEKK